MWKYSLKVKLLMQALVSCAHIQGYKSQVRKLDLCMRVQFMGPYQIHVFAKFSFLTTDLIRLHSVAAFCNNLVNSNVAWPVRIKLKLMIKLKKCLHDHLQSRHPLHHINRAGFPVLRTHQVSRISLQSSSALFTLHIFLLFMSRFIVRVRWRNSLRC